MACALYTANEIVRALFERGIPTPAEYKAARGYNGHDISRCCGIWHETSAGQGVLQVLPTRYAADGEKNPTFYCRYTRVNEAAACHGLVMKQISTEDYKARKAAIDIELDRLREIHSKLKMQTSQMQMDEKEKNAGTERAGGFRGRRADH